MMQPYLKRVAVRMAQGLSNREIAIELGITEATVKVYITRIYDALNIAGENSRVRAVLELQKMQLN